MPKQPHNPERDLQMAIDTLNHCNCEECVEIAIKFMERAKSWSLFIRKDNVDGKQHTDGL